MVPLLTCCVAPSCLSSSLVPNLPSLQALNRNHKSLFFSTFILHSSLAPWAGCSKSRALSSVPTSQCPQHRAQVWQRQFLTKWMHEWMDGSHPFPLGGWGVEAGPPAPHYPPCMPADLPPMGGHWPACQFPWVLVFSALHTVDLFLLFFMKNENPLTVSPKGQQWFSGCTMKVLLIFSFILSLLSCTNICSFSNKKQWWDFPGGPAAKTPCSQCRGPWFDPWSGN